MSSYILRKVSKNWEHPRDGNGNYIPKFGGSYSDYSRGYKERKEMWDNGFQEAWDFVDKKLIAKWIPISSENKFLSFEEYDDEERLAEEYMPDWPENERTHFQMYENVTEGTPASPVFEKVEDLASWLADNLNDDRYPFTSVKWLTLLKSTYPAVDMKILLPVSK